MLLSIIIHISYLNKFNFYSRVINSRENILGLYVTCVYVICLKYVFSARYSENETGKMFQNCFVSYKIVNLENK